MTMSAPRQSLVAQLAQLVEPAPQDYDPEDVGSVGGEPEDASEQRVDPNTGREHYLDVGQSQMRKLADSIAEPKYDGVTVSRSQLLDDEDTHSAVESNPEDEDGEHPGSSAEESENGEEGGQERLAFSARHSSQSPRQDTQSQADVANSQPGNDALTLTLRTAREEERKKGKAVARQLAMYDSLLDARIRLQKCVTSMNRLPTSRALPNYLLTENSRAAADKFLKEVVAVSDEIFTLQEKLLTTNETIVPPPRKRRRIEVPDGEADEAPVRDWEQELQDSTDHAALLESTYHPHLVSTLQKWSNKVLAIAPSALLPSNKTKFSRSGANQVKSAVQLVQETLLDGERLVGRTRVRRGRGSRLGPSDAETDGVAAADGHSGEKDKIDIFEDGDFYQQLLRDVIDSRSGNGLGARLDGLAEDWRAAQKHRKAKKVVDTRASKGRKLRFEVHEKLQNFMAPVPAPAGAALTWHESQIDELFASLLGKGFEQSLLGTANHMAANGTVEGASVGMEGSVEDMNIGQALKGFRVFG